MPAGEAVPRRISEKSGVLQVECCSPSWRPANSSQLEQLLARQLVGQHLAHQLVTGAVRGHLARHTHSKPLVMRWDIGKTL